MGDQITNAVAERVTAFLDAWTAATHVVGIEWVRDDDAPTGQRALTTTDIRQLLAAHAAMAARIAEVEAGPACRSCGTACRVPEPALCLNCAVYGPTAFDANHYFATAVPMRETVRTTECRCGCVAFELCRCGIGCVCLHPDRLCPVCDRDTARAAVADDA